MPLRLLGPKASQSINNKAELAFGLAPPFAFKHETHGTSAAGVQMRYYFQMATTAKGENKWAF